MGRVMPGPRPGTTVRFVPACLGNEKDPDPVVFYIRAPSNADRREWLFDETRAPKRPADDATDEVKTAWLHAMLERRNQFVAKWVESVERYTMGKDGEVKTGEDLAKFGEEPMLNAAMAEIDRLMSIRDDEVKPSAGPQDSSPQATRLSDGIAASAERAASTKSATVIQSAPTQVSATSPSAPA